MIIRHLTREYLDFFGDGFSRIYFVLFQVSDLLIIVPS